MHIYSLQLSNATCYPRCSWNSGRETRPRDYLNSLLFFRNHVRVAFTPNSYHYFSLPRVVDLSPIYKACVFYSLALLFHSLHSLDSLRTWSRHLRTASSRWSVSTRNTVVSKHVQQKCEYKIWQHLASSILVAYLDGAILWSTLPRFGKASSGVHLHSHILSRLFSNV